MLRLLRTRFAGKSWDVDSHSTWYKGPVSSGPPCALWPVLGCRKSFGSGSVGDRTKHTKSAMLEV